MDYGFTITKQGWKLLAKLLTGSQLEITRVVVGSGKVPEGASPGEMMDLVQPVALATSTIPQVENEQVSFIVEYRSDLNGGLKEGFWLNEFGVFANDPDAGEVLLYYATMGDYPQYVSAFTGGSVDIRRYPVSIALSESPEVHLDYPAGAVVTAEEIAESLDKQGVPAGGLEGQMLIKANNKDYATEWGPWPSNPNLLLNWDFRNPVNRNGKSEYAGAGYSIDRWKQYNSNFSTTIKEGYLLLKKRNQNNGRFIMQVIENYKNYIGKTITLSVLFKSNGVFVANITKALSGTSIGLVKPVQGNGEIQFTSITVTVPTDVINLCVFLGFNNDQIMDDFDIELYAAKLELGDQQTLAHQDADGNWVLNDPPNYDLQYALCSQYSPITGEFVGSQHSNPNLLDNWYFADPINQKGLTEYTTTSNSAYSIDRWLCGKGARINIVDGAIRFTKLATTYNLLCQILPSELVNILKGKVVTLSALVKGNGTVAIGNVNSLYQTFSITDENNFILISNTYVFPSSEPSHWEFRPCLSINPGFIDILAIKLELGSVQTLAHKEGDTWVLNDPAPNKASELAKCQRYQLISNNMINSVIGVGTAISTTRLFVTIPLPTTLRTSPKISFNKLIAYGNGFSTSTAPSITAIGYINLSSNCLRCEMTTTNIVAGQSYAIMLSGSDAYFNVDANI